jgi:hypothetical protein
MRANLGEAGPVLFLHFKSVLPMLWTVGLCTVWITQLAMLPAAAQTLHTTTAIYQPAELVKLESNHLWTFLSAERETTIPSSRIVRWGSWPGVRDQPAVWLGDGSWLCGDVQITSSTISVTNDWLKTPDFPVDNVRGVVLAPPASLARWLDLQSQMEAVVGEQDVLWLAGGKRLSGILRWSADSETALNRMVELDASGQRLEVPLESVEAIVFSPALLGPVPAHQNTLQLGLVDGSLLYVSQVEPQTSSVNLSLEGGTQLVSFDGPRQFCKELVLLSGNPALGTTAAIQYLNDLTAASYRHVADSSLTWPLGINRNVYGRSLHTSQAIFSRGLATHSACQVAYRWDGSSARLLAEVAFAAASPQAEPGLGSVQCQVMLARGGELETVERFSLTRRPDGHPLPGRLLNIDLSRAKLIVLVTEKADYGQYGDQVLWLDARIAPPQP